MRGEVNPLFLIAGLLVPFVLFMFIPLEGEEGIPPPFWLNTSFEFRKPIVLNATIERETTEIIIPLTFNTSSLIADGKMQSDCSDIRVTNNLTVELEYFLELHTCNTNETIIWVETTLFLENNTHLIYYGNTTAENETTKNVFSKAQTVYLGYRNPTPTSNTPNEIDGRGDAVYSNAVIGEIKGYDGNTTNLSESDDFANVGDQPTKLGGNFTIYSWMKINKYKNGDNVHYLYDTSGITMKYENITSDQSLFRWACVVRNATDSFIDFNTSLEFPVDTWFLGACSMNQTNTTAFVSDRSNFAEQNEDLVGGFRFTASITRLGASFGSGSTSNMNGTYDSFFIYNVSKPVSFLNIIATLNTTQGIEENVTSVRG